MQLIDAHAHLTFAELAGDIEGVLARSRAAGVVGWVTVGTGYEENVKAVALAQTHEGIWAGVGIHPHYAKDATFTEIIALKVFAKQPKVVAIGETGLDFHYNFSKQDAQKTIFRAQLKIAAETGLPVIVHSRNAFDETMEILGEFEGKLKNVVFHCFGGDAAQAKIVVEKGWYVSFTGVVTFKNATVAREAAAAVPLERMMVETDCPYMTPEPMRKQKVNEPSLMVHTAAKLAEIKGVPVEVFAEIVTKATTTFFGIQHSGRI
jgi:TatD DNase family protein